MIRKVVTILSLFVSVWLFGEQNENQKLGARLKVLLSLKPGHSAALTQHLAGEQSELLNVFIRGNAANLTGYIEGLGGYVNTVTEDVLTAQLPKAVVQSVAAHPGVERIQLASRVFPKNDQAVKHIQGDKVHRGTTPLEGKFTGSNVIVGIIDSGIDFQHEDFRVPGNPGKSRILSIWDQNDGSGVRPGGFSYGSEWTKTQIEAELSSSSPPGTVKHRDTNGHGTHVAGSAAGNLGLAPGADIIVVGLNFQASTSVVDAANYIFQKAKELGKPAVINASLGTHVGPHDGTSAEAKALDNLVKAEPGRAFVAAAGNEGGDYIHYGGFEHGGGAKWSYYFGPLSEEALFQGKTLFVQYAIVENRFEGLLSFAVGMDSTAAVDASNGIRPVRYIGNTPWKTLQELKAAPSAYLVNYRDGSRAGKVQISASNIDAQKSEIYIVVEDTIQFNAFLGQLRGLDLWRLYSKGSGEFHSWTIVGNPIPNPAASGILVDGNYQASDNNYSVGMPACGIKAIAVGAYNNRETYVDINGQTQPSADRRAPEKAIASFSSIGPSRDKRVKPEITAPGHLVASSFSKDASMPDSYILPGRKRVIMSGTSMATPVTSGAIALLLQQSPKLSIDEIRAKLFKNTMSDKFTGTLPNNTWGYGKLDIFGAMTRISTPIRKSDETITEHFSLAQNYPNPFNPVTSIDYYVPFTSKVVLKVYNILGQEVRTLVNQVQRPGAKSVIWNGLNNNAEKVASGVYLYKMEAGNFSKIYKMVLLK